MWHRWYLRICANLNVYCKCASTAWLAGTWTDLDEGMRQSLHDRRLSPLVHLLCFLCVFTMLLKIIPEKWVTAFLPCLLSQICVHVWLSHIVCVASTAKQHMHTKTKQTNKAKLIPNYTHSRTSPAKGAEIMQKPVLRRLVLLIFNKLTCWQHHGSPGHTSAVSQFPQGLCSTVDSHTVPAIPCQCRRTQAVPRHSRCPCPSLPEFKEADNASEYLSVRRKKKKKKKYWEKITSHNCLHKFQASYFHS